MTEMPAATVGAAEMYPLLRYLAAWLLVVLACLAIPLSVVVWWAVTSVDNESQYVTTLAPLARNQAVMSSVTDDVTNALLAQAEHSPVPVPVRQLRPAVRAAVATAVAGPSFPGIWTAAVRASYPTVVALVRGEPGSDMPVVLNLTPVVDEVVVTLHAGGITALDPVLDSAKPHAVITVVPTSQVRDARQVFHDLLDLRWILPIVGGVALVGALLLAPRRRGVVVGLGIGTALVSGAIIGLLSGVHAVMVGDIHPGGSTTAASVAVFDALVRYLRIDLFITGGAALALALGVAIWWIVGSIRPGRRSDPVVRPGQPL